jgi:hypothetical protein
VTRTLPGQWLAILAVSCTLLAATLGLAAENPPPPEQHEEDYDEAEGAFLGGPDPPCMLPCVVVLWLLIMVAFLVVLVLGLVVTSVALVCAAVLLAAGTALALWLVWQGMWVAGVLVFLPPALLLWYALRKSRRRVRPPNGP